MSPVSRHPVFERNLDVFTVLVKMGNSTQTAGKDIVTLFYLLLDDTKKSNTAQKVIFSTKNVFSK